MLLLIKVSVIVEFTNDIQNHGAFRSNSHVHGKSFLVRIALRSLVGSIPVLTKTTNLTLILVAYFSWHFKTFL